MAAITNLGPGLAPDVYVTDGHIYVAYGVDSPTSLVLALLYTQGTVITSKTIPNGFFNSFPRFGGPWLAYKTGDPTYGPATVNVLTGEAATYPGVAGGNYPICVNEALALVAYQNGSYPVWFGTLNSGIAQPNGQQGAPDGLDTLISATDVTLRKDTRTSVPGIYYPVKASDLTVGEWFTPPYGVGVLLSDDPSPGLRVVFSGQDCPTPRCATDGTTYAIVTGGPTGVRIWIGSFWDLTQLPTAASLTPAPPFEPHAVTPPRAADGRFYNMKPFIECDPALSPRGGPGQQSTVQVQLNDGQILYGKFDSAQSYERYDIDENWMYSRIDASSLTTCQVWTDPRWFPMEMAIGESHAFVTGDHEAVWLDRGTCLETSRLLFNRKMWLHALWDEYDWGPDLGIRATIMRVYDNTGGVPGPGRFIEVRYEADGAGWCRWDRYDSTKVYPNGPNGGAVFPPEALLQRVDFYRLGGANVQPVQVLCIPTANKPTYPPLTPSVSLGDLVMIDPKTVVLYKSLNPSSKAGCVNLILHDGSVFSCQADGSPGTRPAGTDGPWEQAQVTGSLATFNSGSGVTEFYCFGIAPIDKVL